MLILIALERHQASIQSLAEVLEAVMDATERSHEVQHSNFMSLLDAVEQLAALNGVSLQKQASVVDTSSKTTEGENVIPFPTNKTKH